MKKLTFHPIFSAAKATGLLAWQTGRVFQQLAKKALDAVQEVLQAEIRKGNVQLVTDFLTDKALPAAKALLLERMATRLLVRIGLRGALASNVVGWILPFVLERLVKVGVKTGFFEKVKSHGTVTEALHRLEELKRATWKFIAPDAGSGAELVTEEEIVEQKLLNTKA
ncbi:hypothetical protein SAMN02745146_2569 [Hymenobacter daecheongensis DSM 21074]|uniref:Uncharacterized protein n=1 Tax=Hymenobacter daecheongensis DSM 21074 TaxID=1121955 RepID=A0A1M6HMX6_9BACT|nr:hypothetical protein [Hymenobacter daecheongensis]SHJ23542.1 hypothetical protein SAMN02745146_2569 [Hymenobacter daecheongensis DSM 21074]